MSMRIVLTTIRSDPDSGHEQEKVTLFSYDGEEPSSEFKTAMGTEILRIMQEETDDREADDSGLIASDFNVRIEFP
jgi:hypothetical protein